MSKTIELKDEKLKDLLSKKGALIEQGRTLSDEIEKLEVELEEINTKLLEEEKKVDISDIDFKAEELTQRFNDLKAEMDGVNKAVKARMLEKMPKELTDKYDELMKVKKDKEEERNKIAIKAQKYNDKIVPVVRKLLAPHLEDEFEDFDSVSVEDGVVKGRIFSHLEEFKNNFKNSNLNKRG